MATIKLPSGLEVTTYEPPRDFDPGRANAGDLEKFGFPPRPKDPRHLARYEHVLSQMKGKLNYIQPTLRENAERFHGPRKRLATAGVETSSNWSGGVVYAPEGQSFTWIEGDWVIPNVDAPTDNEWYYAASWIGIDGDGSDDVFQAGIGSAVYRSGTSVTRSFAPWWEWYPAPEVEITNFPVSPGDMVTLLLCTDGPGAGSTGGTLFFSNRTSGAFTSLNFRAPADTKLVGNCAEWIVEAPTVGGQLSSLANYGEVFFSVCEAFLTNHDTVGGGTGDSIDMTDGGGTVISKGNLITDTIVQCEYVGG